VTATKIDRDNFITPISACVKKGQLHTKTRLATEMPRGSLTKKLNAFPHGLSRNRTVSSREWKSVLTMSKPNNPIFTQQWQINDATGETSDLSTDQNRPPGKDRTGRRASHSKSLRNAKRPL
jgi:hypothetical protein